MKLCSFKYLVAIVLFCGILSLMGCINTNNSSGQNSSGYTSSTATVPLDMDQIEKLLNKNRVWGDFTDENLIASAKIALISQAENRDDGTKMIQASLVTDYIKALFNLDVDVSADQDSQSHSVPKGYLSYKPTGFQSVTGHRDISTKTLSDDELEVTSTVYGEGDGGEWHRKEVAVLKRDSKAYYGYYIVSSKLADEEKPAAVQNTSKLTEEQIQKVLNLNQADGEFSDVRLINFAMISLFDQGELVPAGSHRIIKTSLVTGFIKDLYNKNVDISAYPVYDDFPAPTGYLSYLPRGGYAFDKHTILSIRSLDDGTIKVTCDAEGSSVGYWWKCKEVMILLPDENTPYDCYIVSCNFFNYEYFTAE